MGILSYANIAPTITFSEAKSARLKAANTQIPFALQTFETAGTTLRTTLTGFSSDVPFVGTSWQTNSVSFQIVLSVLGSSIVEASAEARTNLTNQITLLTDKISQLETSWKTLEAAVNALQNAYNKSAENSVERERIVGEKETAKALITQYVSEDYEAFRQIKQVEQEFEGVLIKRAEETLEADKGSLLFKLLVEPSNGRAIFVELKNPVIKKIAQTLATYQNVGQGQGVASCVYRIEWNAVYQFPSPFTIQASEQVKSLILIEWPELSAVAVGSYTNEFSLAIPLLTLNYENTQLVVGTQDYHLRKHGA